MTPKSLIILTGPPGSGKTTVGPLVASSFSPSVCLQADLFWASIVEGAIEPWLKESNEQNRVMIKTASAASLRLVEGGYTVVLEGILGPWFLPLMKEEMGTADISLAYVILRPTIEECLKRANERRLDPRHAGALNEEGPIRDLHRQFMNLDDLEENVIDTSAIDERETANIIVKHLQNAKKFTIPLSESHT